MSPPVPLLSRLFATALHAYRSAGGRLTLTQLAERSGVGRVTLSRWLHGHQPPDGDLLGGKVLPVLGAELTLRWIEGAPQPALKKADPGP